ncbi:sulfite exporter TauE/SafE family protein [Crocinitomicaceae bacterium]|nr:sulfite exporter TauE/SafE family protein [Crocinitomicaceae bacterium]
MEDIYIVILIAFISFSASMLTFFSGFGLGTMLLPVFCLFMPIELAVLSTAMVHILNNFLKFILIRKLIDRSVLLSFGISAVIASFIGAMLQSYIGDGLTGYSVSLFSKVYQVDLLSLVIGGLMIVFAILDLIPWSKKLTFEKNMFVSGGFLSGFFGGLSGHQGALRAAFLSKANLSAEIFISTSVCLSLLIDVVRIPVYFASNDNSIELYWRTILLACIFAFLGSYIGKKMFSKKKIKNVRFIVASFLLIMGTGMILGLI